MRILTLYTLGYLLLSTIGVFAQSPPEGFVRVKDVIPEIALEMRYATNNNFVGEVIPGYNKPVAILTLPAAAALKNASEEFFQQGFGLKIFDAYRPRRAVNKFITWARDTGDTLMKPVYYPNVQKKDLFSLGYISTRSGHSRGSTVDITLIDLATGKPVDMGGNYDFFGEISHHDAAGLSKEQIQNRSLLKKIMRNHGFIAYPQEWWHYTFHPEPYPNTYFDFPVE